MTLNERKKYLCCTSIAFLAGCTIFLVLGVRGFRFINHKCVDISPLQEILELVRTVFFGGYLLGGIAAGIVLIGYFIRGKAKWQVALTIVFVLLVVCIESLFLLGLISMGLVYLYNLIYVLKKGIVDEV